MQENTHELQENTHTSHVERDDKMKRTTTIIKYLEQEILWEKINTYLELIKWIKE